MLFPVFGASLLGLAARTAATPAPSRHSSRSAYIPNAERADAVKAAFKRAWDGYYKYAFPHDSLLPVTNSYEDDRYDCPCQAAQLKYRSPIPA